MPITTLLGGLPQRTMSQEAFDAAMAKFMTDLPKFAGEVNATEANMNAAAAGGVFSFQYTVDTASTADSAPASGKLRFDNATQNTATTLRLNNTSGGTDISTLLDQFDASTNTVKGSIRLQKVGDASKWLVFNVTARTSLTGYRNISVSCVGGSSASPFVNNDAVMLSFQRAGDVGPTGSAANNYPPTFYVRDEKAQGVGGGLLGISGSTRTFNTVKVNTIGAGASLSSNVITLPAGTYEYEGCVPYVYASTGVHKSQLYNNTDAVVVDNGTSEAVGEGANTTPISSRSYLRGVFTISATKAFIVKHFYSNSGGTDAAGKATNLGGVEVYAEIIFRKVA